MEAGVARLETPQESFNGGALEDCEWKIRARQLLLMKKEAERDEKR